MVAASLVISIDRTSLGLSPLHLSAKNDGTPLGIVGYQPPAYQARVQYAPESPYIAGALSIASVWQQSMMGVDVVADLPSEAAAAAALTELRVALSQHAYQVTVSVSDADSESWHCDMGSLAPAAREFADLTYVRPVMAVTIPVYPIPVS